MIIASKAQRERGATKLNSPGFTQSQYAGNPDIIFDPELNFRTQMGFVTKSAFCHLKYVVKVLPFL